MHGFSYEERVGVPTTTRTNVYKALVSIIPKASSPEIPFERIFLVPKFIHSLGPLTVALALGEASLSGRQPSESQETTILDTRWGRGQRASVTLGVALCPKRRLHKFSWCMHFRKTYTVVSACFHENHWAQIQ